VSLIALKIIANSGNNPKQIYNMPYPSNLLPEKMAITNGIESSIKP
jgi:hypothetical protein